jgi:ribonuclease HI/uncharacterized phage-like protein YoqJ
MADRTKVYTDGACSGNPGPGGWAWVVPDGPHASGADPDTTNQRMELKAVLDAVEHLEGPLEVVSDSTYVVNCFRDRWWEGWLRRGWINSQKKPVANRDLWEPLINLYRGRDIDFTWVKGHAGNRWNDMADRLAVEAAQSQRARSGTTIPSELGPADVGQAGLGTVESGESGRPRPRSAIQGHPLLIVGHRPPELGGYGETLLAAAVRSHLEAIIGAKATMHDDLVVVSGLNLGVEMLGAEAAAHAGVPYVAVLANPGQDGPWPSETKRRFSRLLDNALEVVTLQKQVPETKQKIGASYRRRDAWLRRNVTEAVAVWDGSDEFVGRTVKSLQDELGEDQVWLVDPDELGAS